MSHSPMQATSSSSRRPEPRPPLPAGHPVSWSILTCGTVLDGTPWPGAPMTRAAPSPGEWNRHEQCRQVPSH